MNYAGKFGSGELDPFSGADSGLGPLLSSHGHLSTPGKVHVDKVSTHAPSDAIIISDAHLLFHGDFKRSGVDLVLTSGDRELVLHDYFKGEKRAALASPDGAHLTGDIVNALAGHTQFAQADGSASVAPAIIGHVTKLTGNATAIRNGVSIILNQGDTVHKGDVVQSGSDSTLGITFIDGTVFGLASNAKMVLNEMIYDPNGSDNKSLLSLVQGTISFVAGATAKKGDMKVDTPVATMGIRGTAVLVEIDFEVPGQGGAPPAKFQVLVEPDGTTGSYILFDKTTLTQIATVNRAGTQTIINGQGAVSFQSSVQLSPDAQKIISDVFSLKFTDLNNPNTKLTTNFTDSIVPETVFLKLASNAVVPVTLQFLTIPERPAVSPSTGPSPTLTHIPGPPAADASGDSFTELVDTTGNAAVDSASGVVTYLDINVGDTPSVSAQFSSFTYQSAQGTDVSAKLTAEQLAAVKAVEVPLVVVQDPKGKNFGTATWTYNVADGAFDFLAAGETLKLTYMARVDNNYAPFNETTFVPFTIVITGTNDKPTISATGGEITERIGTGNTVIDTVTGTVTFADVDLTDRPVVSAAISTTDPFRYYDAEGNDITATLTPEQLAAILAVEVPLTVVQSAGNTNKGSATWTYSIEDSKFDFIAKGETLTLNYVAQVDDGHGGVISTPITVSIQGADVVVIGTNDLPTIAATSDAFAELSNASQPNPTGSNALHVASGTISFTDVDLTDRPVASAAFTSFTYLNTSSVDVASQLTTAQLAAIAAVDEPLTVVQAQGNTNNGSANWSYSVSDSAFDFLAYGEILTLTYTATVDDGHGGVVTKPITVTVTGSNDTAEITSDPQTAALTERADTHGSATPDTASGAITFVDADLTDTHDVKITGVHASGVMTGLANGAVQLSWLSLGPLSDSTDGVQGSKSWSFSAPDNYFDYLADGEAVTLTYTVEVDDHHGGVTSQDIVVTVNGSNDAPDIADIALQGLAEQADTAPLTTTISVTFTDLDLLDVGHSATISGAAATGTTTGLALDEAALIALVKPGMVTKAAGSSAGSVNLSFSAASTAFDYLAKGEVLTLTYTVSIDDGDGGVTPKTFVVTVTGTDDAPAIANIAQQDLTEQADTAPLTATIPVTFTDVDLTDVGHSADITGVVASGDTNGLALDETALIALVTPGTVTKAFGSSSGSVDLDFSAASPAFDYLAAGEQLMLTYMVTIDDGDGGVTPQTFVVTVTGTNDGPVFTGAELAPTYQAGDAAVALAGSVSASDVDSSNYAGGSLTAAVTNGGHEGDTLSIANGDVISLSGTDILYDADGAAGPASAQIIGTLSGYDTNSLTLALNGNANGTAVAALAQAIEFSNDKPDAVAGERIVTFTLQDGGGTANGAIDHASFTTKVTVTEPTSNTAPVIQTEQLSISENGDGTTTVSGLYVTDPDTGDTFSVAVVSASAATAGSSVEPSTGSGTLTKVNDILSSVTYDDGLGTQQTDMVTFTVSDGDATDTVNFIFNVAGSDGLNTTTLATSSKDVIFSTDQADILKGGAGADQFVFAEEMGNDIVTDFVSGQDKIDLLTNVPFTPDDAASFNSWVNSGVVEQVGADTLIQFDGSNGILLSNVAKASLHMSDFILHPSGSGNI
ncbi:VCBS domain-containing protein [Bradyrhizobium sp. 190]|uniref:VCBS domain-containing protein n=1 Tax=Bradyrhizobium sp. 190 TaxID=2782658 RepID=UPI001FFC29AF|nr:VCBS domain-containing protein [Bradyrhizobium sp. 190]MCK1512825.1 VCBS domain-containing protein [Bradyrhizobium sp. 190]